MTTLSWTERNRRRGALTTTQFLICMAERGFIEKQPGVNSLYEFTHPDAPDYVFVVPLRNAGFNAALGNMCDELARFQP